MKKTIFFLALIILSFFGNTQALDGAYFALELNGLTVDTSGKVYFYMSDSFPKEKWFHEIRVVINGNYITIKKYPVSYDSTGKKWYSASDGGFLTYRGTLNKISDLYVANTKLVDFDYIGISYFDAPQISDDVDSSYTDTSRRHSEKPFLNEIRETHDVTKGIHGTEVFLPKGTLRQNFIIRPDKDGLWINNVFYYRQKKRRV